MRTLTFVCAFLGVCAVAVFITLRIKKGGMPGVISKAIASFIFILTALFASLANENAKTAFCVLIICGLTVSLCGDVFLDLRNLHEKACSKCTAAGMACFAAAHIFYSTALLLIFPVNAVSGLVPVAVAAAFAAGIIFSEKLFKLDYKKFKPLCFIYAFLLSLTMCYAFAVAVTTEFNSQLSAFFFAAVLFVISDIILSHMYFSMQNSERPDGFSLNKSPLMIASNHITYYAAQYLIALTILL